MYLSCYEELASKLPGPPTSLILGDAYMHVQEVSVHDMYSCMACTYVMTYVTYMACPVDCIFFFQNGFEVYM